MMLDGKLYRGEFLDLPENLVISQWLRMVDYVGAED